MSPARAASPLAPLALLLATCTLAVPAGAQTNVTLVKNNGQSFTDAQARGYTRDYATAFTTGSSSGGYRLSRVDVWAKRTADDRPAERDGDLAERMQRHGKIRAAIRRRGRPDGYRQTYLLPADVCLDSFSFQVTLQSADSQGRVWFRGSVAFRATDVWAKLTVTDPHGAPVVANRLERNLV